MVLGFLKATDHSDLVASWKTLCSFAGTVGPVGHPDRWGHRVGGPRARQHLCAGVRAGLEVATWLILPVVIRSSQRLSHARLSKSNFTVKLRMAHYISLVGYWPTMALTGNGELGFDSGEGA